MNGWDGSRPVDPTRKRVNNDVYVKTKMFITTGHTWKSGQKGPDVKVRSRGVRPPWVSDRPHPTPPSHLFASVEGDETGGSVAVVPAVCLRYQSYQGPDIIGHRSLSG